MGEVETGMCFLVNSFMDGLPTDAIRSDKRCLNLIPVHDLLPPPAANKPRQQAKAGDILSDERVQGSSKLVGVFFGRLINFMQQPHQLTYVFDVFF